MRMMIVFLCLLLPACVSITIPEGAEDFDLGRAAEGHDALARDSKQEVTVPVQAAETAALSMVFETPRLSPILDQLPDADLHRARQEAARVYLKHWPRVAERSRLVRGHLVPELKRLHAPLDLELLPIIESAYSPYAYSSAGAMGLWQLMPATAKMLGVSHVSGVNARRDTRASTDAAIRYLLSLHKRFGNWPVAFAAYHRGPGAMRKRLRHHPWQPSDGLSKMPVPQITRSYVRHMVGLVVLKEEGVLSFPDVVALQRLRIPAPIDLARLARLADWDQKQLFLFNPQLDQQQYVRGSIELYVPEERLAKLKAAISQSRPKTSSIRVHQGDSLWSIAVRHHCSVARLQAMNPGVDEHLRLGQILHVPSFDVAWHTPDSNPYLSQGKRIRYRVRSGDSLWRIAQRFGTTPEAIARANGVHTQKLLHPGQHLWVIARIRS